ncbi:MAG TPA: four helix bundle protein, partial [Pyrinomonadaceae bacterium]|nr:four helix bundle protein [Pyrinomonadaceae bacterium]
MAESIVLAKAIAFALRIIKLYKYLTEEKREFVLSKQILISGAHIAKHVKAALHARAKQGFSNEMYSGLQKALDTELWLLLLHEGQFINDEQYASLNDDCREMIRLTSKISKTSQ